MTANPSARLAVVVVLSLWVGLGACRKKTLEYEPEPAPVDPAEVAEATDEPIDSPTAEPEAAPVAVEHTEAEYRVGTLADVQLVRLFAEPFRALKPTQRVFAYHLSRALLAGRDIAFDQIHRDGLDVRHLVECILRNPSGTDPMVEAKLLEYFQLLGIHGGFYDRFTGLKFVPSLSFEAFEATAAASHAMGADLGLAKNEPLEAKLSRLRPTMFDPQVEPQLVPLDVGKVQDVLAESRLNLYVGVGLRDLRGFTERYPGNSRLIRIDSKLVEEVYRAGDKRRKIAPGRYAGELRRVIRRLQDAVSVAERAQRRILSELIEGFRSGDPTAFDNAQRVIEESNAPVEFAIGFFDKSLDPRGVKGIYGGMVGFIDPPVTSRLQTLLRHVQVFEDRMPWPEENRRHWGEGPQAVAVQLLTTTGRLDSPEAFSLRIGGDPSSPGGSRGKVLLLTNALEAYRRAVALPLVREFAPPEQRETLQTALAEIFTLRSALRSVIGWELGKEDPQAPGRLRNAYVPMQSLKAEAAALWLLEDPKLVELGLLTGNDAGESGLDWALVEGVVAQALDPAEHPSPMALAQRMLVRYLVEKSGGVEWQEFDGKWHLVIKDRVLCRQAIERLLRRCQRALATGDRASAIKLIAQVGGPPQWMQLPSLRERAQAIGLRRLVSYVMPKLSPKRDESGRVVDAEVSHSETLDRQLLRYGRY